MTLEEEACAFYAAIGEAITEWSSVEDMLYLVFLGCVSPARHETAAAAFFAMDGFSAKRQMTDAVVNAVFTGRPELQKWEKISLDVWRKYPKRNALAHHQVLIQPKKKTEGRRYSLRPPVLNPLSPSAFDKNQGVHMNEIKQRIKSFKDLARRIRAFHMSVGKGRVHYVAPDGETSTKGKSG